MYQHVTDDRTRLRPPSVSAPAPTSGVEQLQGALGNHAMRKLVESGSACCAACERGPAHGRCVSDAVRTRRIAPADAFVSDGAPTSAREPAGGDRATTDEPIAPANPADAKQPLETITIDDAKRRRKYGARATYCYDGAKNWWFKEKVTQKSGGCGDEMEIDETTKPFQSPTGCIIDDIFNTNGPPRLVAPCSDVTEQTVFLGPTERDVEHFHFSHTQTIAVAKRTNWHGTVTTSVGDVSTSREY